MNINTQMQLANNARTILVSNFLFYFIFLLFVELVYFFLIDVISVQNESGLNKSGLVQFCGKVADL